MNRRIYGKSSCSIVAFADNGTQIPDDSRHMCRNLILKCTLLVMRVLFLIAEVLKVPSCAHVNTVDNPLPKRLDTW